MPSVRCVRGKNARAGSAGILPAGFGILPNPSARSMDLRQAPPMHAPWATGQDASCVLRMIVVSLVSRGGWPIRGWRGRGSGSAGGMKCHGPVFWARRSRADARTAAAPFCRSQTVFFVSRWSRAAASAATLAASSSSSIQPSWWKSSSSLIRLLGLRPSCPASNSPMMMQR